MIKATLTFAALLALTACEVGTMTTGVSDPLAGEFTSGGSQGAHPPGTTRLGAAP